jgi:GTPase SAR1 family protein
MSIDYEAALNNLRQLNLLGPTDRNEATTRFHLIDVLLKEVLAWEIADIECETILDSERTDYILGNPRRFAVWEAKREGIQFELPVGFNKQICKLQTLRELGGALKSAIDQVQKYAQLHGLPIAVICNGRQVIAFLGSRQDGVPPLEGNALCFTSLEDIEESFDTFWGNLSKRGVETSLIQRTLRSDGMPLPPSKLSASLHPYPGIKGRNDLQVSLKQLGELFLFDLATLPQNEHEFLERCYANTGALSQHALVSKQILESRYALLMRGEESTVQLEAAATKQGLSAEFAESVTHGSTPDEVAAALKRRPIIVLGDVGVGKTVFLRNLIQVTARAQLDKSITLYVDFLREPALAQDLAAFVQSRCEIQLRDDYGIDLHDNKFVRDVYRGDLIRFSRGVYGPYKESRPDMYLEKEIAFLEEKINDHSGHLRASLEQIVKSRRRQIVLFLDNIDQRTEDFQEQVYVIGHALAESWPIVAFICLRPDTFFKSRAKGSLSAYQPRAFSITPPRIDSVVVKRLQYALAKMSNEGRMENFPTNIVIDSPSLQSFLQALIKSLQQNDALVELIDNLSGRNVRSALDFVNTFIGSGHVDARKIIEKQNDSGYTISEHEFLRAVIFGDQTHYDPRTSQICNLFDVTLPDGREHFLLTILLSYIERSADSGEGFSSASGTFRFAQDLQFGSLQIYSALERAVGRGLLETSPKFATSDRWEEFRITSVGAYSTKRLLSSFAYVDAMIVDTPIMDPIVRAAIRNATTIHQRLDRFEIFLDYLSVQAGKVDWRAAGFDLDTSFEALRQDFQRARRGAMQSRGGASGRLAT